MSLPYKVVFIATYAFNYFLPVTKRKKHVKFHNYTVTFGNKFDILKRLKEANKD